MAIPAYHITLVDALDQMAMQARLDELPPPVIEIDHGAAWQFVRLLANSIGCRVADMQPPPGMPENYIAMYDDIKIVARWPQTCKHEVDGWREHFGPLAEIWS